MTLHPHQTPDPQGPFSPIQTGCALVMLANMLIYFCVVAFTFNLLDPSGMDSGYLAGRGFKSKPEPEGPPKAEARPLLKANAAQSERPESAKTRQNQPASPAGWLSRIEQRWHPPARPDDPAPQKAALTESSRAGGAALPPAPGRRRTLALYPQATVSLPYSPYLPAAPRLIALEHYTSQPVALAPGLDFPAFSLPTANSAAAYLYRPPEPVAETARGGRRLSAPLTGASPLGTNRIKTPAETPPANRPAKEEL